MSALTRAHAGRRLFAVDRPTHPRSRLWWALPVLVGLLLGSALTPSAAAFYGNGARIVSVDFGRLEQGDDTTQYAAMSPAGRYVVIQTLARNLFPDGDADPPGAFRHGGLFRFDLETNRIELVADGDLRDESNPDELLVRGAKNPSVSANGRFIAFSTGQRLTPADVNGNVDVYVRDMNVAMAAPGAFDLVSAKDGGDTPVSYAPPAVDAPGRNPGVEVTRGTAISADGSRVAFRSAAVVTDLPDRPSPDTPGQQLFVRDRAAKRTTLVTRVSGTTIPAGGAAGPAAISADGSTVVWTGANVQVQTRFIGGENPDPSFFYYLWRRLDDGPDSATRRVTGMADPDDPDCPPGATVGSVVTETGPCYGPLSQPELFANSSLGAAVSGDGYTVAFTTLAGPRPDANTGFRLDLYVTRMDPGMTRKAATTELTREGGADDTEASSPIEDIALSADGRWIGMTTSRSRFALPTLRQTGTRRLVPNARELYVVDLSERTIERVTRSIDGGDINAGLSSEPSLSMGGDRIAFTAFASNLFFGDANSRPDAFVATRTPEPPAAPPPPGHEQRADDDVTEDLGGDEILLPTTVRRLASGALELRIRVPAPGTLTITARGKASVGRSRPATRVLARANKFSPRAARVSVRLKLVRRYRGQLKRHGAMPARVDIVFNPSRGGRRLSRSLRVVFRHMAAKRRAGGR